MRKKFSKRILFEEKGWTVAKGDGPSNDLYVEHLTCAKPLGPDEILLSVSPTYYLESICYHCNTRFPDFIRNMLMFVKWCQK